MLVQNTKTSLLYKCNMWRILKEEKLKWELFVMIYWDVLKCPRKKMVKNRSSCLKKYKVYLSSIHWIFYPLTCFKHWSIECYFLLQTRQKWTSVQAVKALSSTIFWSSCSHAIVRWRSASPAPSALIVTSALSSSAAMPPALTAALHWKHALSADRLSGSASSYLYDNTMFFQSWLHISHICLLL